MLDRFYAHALNRMLEANRRNDPGICDELVAFLSPMRASWAQLADGAPPGSPPAGDRPPAPRPASLVT